MRFRDYLTRISTGDWPTRELFVAVCVAIFLIVVLFLPTVMVDTRENIVWSRQMVWTTPRHPPLMVWAAGLGDWLGFRDTAGYVFLQLLLGGVTFAYAERLAGTIGGKPSGTIAGAICCGATYLHANSIVFALNADMLQIPCWLGAVYHAVMAKRSQLAGHYSLTGFWVGLALLAKYFSVFLVFGLVVSALMVPAYRQALFKVKTILPVAIAALIVAPHFFALWTLDNSAIQYALAEVSTRPRGLAWLSTLSAVFLGILIMFPILVMFPVILTPFGKKLIRFDKLMTTDDGRFISLFTGLSLLAIILVAIAFEMKVEERFVSPLTGPLVILFALVIAPSPQELARFWHLTVGGLCVGLAGYVIIDGGFIPHSFMKEPAPAFSQELRQEWELKFGTDNIPLILGDKATAHIVALYWDDAIGFSLFGYQWARERGAINIAQTGAIIVNRQDRRLPQEFSLMIPKTTSFVETSYPYRRLWYGQFSYRYVFLPPEEAN